VHPVGSFCAKETHLAQNIQFSSFTAFFLSAALLRHCFIGNQQTVQPVLDGALESKTLISRKTEKVV
jgi:hypothetical protein